MGLSTKEIKTGEGGIPKVIAPGDHVLKINKVELKRWPFMDADDGYFFVLHTETEAIEGFEGFFFDKDDESLGRHSGQIGQIKTNRYYYKDGETKSGIQISRDTEILKQIKNICMAADALEWFDKVDNKFNSIEEFVEAFNTKAPFKDKFFNICVGGKEFERKNGYIGHDLFFPKGEKGKVVLEGKDSAVSKVLAYNESKHLMKIDAAKVSSFTGDETPVIPGGDPLAGAPEFEL
jgi:hypothetical protein